MGAVGEVIAFRLRHQGPTVHQGRWFNTPEDRALRLEWQRGVAARVCCRAAYFMEAVTLSVKVPDELGLPITCPARCPDYVAFTRAQKADHGGDPDRPSPWRGGRP